MEQRYLIDTNVVCDYIGGLIPANGMTFLDSVVDAVPNLSIITQIELRSWNVEAETEAVIVQFILDSSILNINADVVEYCAGIRKARKMKAPDAIIAATALAHDLVLLTRNIADFRQIND